MKNKEIIKQYFFEYIDHKKATVSHIEGTEEIIKKGLQVIDLLTPSASKSILAFHDISRGGFELDYITASDKATDREKRTIELINGYINIILSGDVGKNNKDIKIPNTFHCGASVLQIIKDAEEYYYKPTIEGKLSDNDFYSDEYRGIVERCYKSAVEDFTTAVKLAIKSMWDKDINISESPESEEVEAVTSIIPNKYFILNDKVNKLIPKIDIDGQEQPIRISASTKKDIITTVILNYEGNALRLSDEENWTAYDRAVHNAVVSLWEAGNRKFTPEMVYRAMNGLNGNIFISPTALQKVEKSIDKSMSITVYIDCGEVAKAYGGNSKGKLQAKLLEVRKAILQTENGTKKVGYVFISERFKPILYEYSQMTKQILSVTPNLLQTKKALNTTDETIVIREYLLRRIEEMKSPRNTISYKIKFNSIMELLQLKEITKKKKQKIKDQIAKLLQYYKEIEYITDYNEYKTGRVIEGVEIEI